MAAVSRLSSCVSAAVAAAAAASLSSSASNRAASADYSSRFPFFSYSKPSSSEDNDSKESKQSTDGKKSEDVQEPKGSGFDPEALERGAKALREINNSPHAKQV